LIFVASPPAGWPAKPTDSMKSSVEATTF
jgi:hypothetical protein